MLVWSRSLREHCGKKWSSEISSLNSLMYLLMIIVSGMPGWKSSTHGCTCHFKTFPDSKDEEIIKLKKKSLTDKYVGVLKQPCHSCLLCRMLTCWDLSKKVPDFGPRFVFTHVLTYHFYLYAFFLLEQRAAEKQCVCESLDCEWALALFITLVLWGQFSDHQCLPPLQRHV